MAALAPHDPLFTNRPRGLATQKSQPYPLHFILGQSILCPIIELCRTRAFVRCHHLRVLQCSTVGEVSSDACCTKAVVADWRHDAGGKSPPAHHAPGVRLSHRRIGQQDTLMAAAGAEHPALLVLGDAGRGNVGMQVLGKAVMARHRVLLAAFLMQADQPTRALGLQILHPHLERRADARKAIGEGGDECPVAQVAHRFRRNSVNQPPPFTGFQHRGLSSLHHMLGAAHGRRPGWSERPGQ